VSTHDYNYAVFNLQREIPYFTEFQDHPMHAGRTATDFPLEDLSTGSTARMADLWSAGLVVIEFGSFT